MSKYSKKPAKAKTILVVGPGKQSSGGMSMQTEMLVAWLQKQALPVRFVQTNADLGWLNHIRLVRGVVRTFIMCFKLFWHLPSAKMVHLMANSGGSWYMSAMPALKLSAFFGVPVIVNYRGGGAELFFAKHMKWIRADFEKAAKIVVPSSFLATVFKKYGFESEIVPNAVDLAKFTSAHKQTRKSIDCFIARHLEPIYGIDLAIAALKQVTEQFPTMRLLIAGVGPARAELEQLVESLDLSAHVVFLGKLDSQKMAHYYQNATLLINPSRVDNMPNSLLEAQASGLAILTTDVGGIKHMVKHLKTAYLVPPENVEALAQAWIKLLGDKVLRARLAHHGLIAVQSLSWPNMIKRWLHLYQEVGEHVAKT